MTSACGWQGGSRLLCAFVVCLAGCASGRRAPQIPTPPDLDGARAALAAAHAAGVEEELPDAIARAEGDLTEAEAVVAAGDAKGFERAGCLARLAESEATTAVALLGRLKAERGQCDERTRQLKEKVERASAERQGLEARIDVLMRDLELTETEVIRTKARLKGLASRAEASSAIAEATILVRRGSSDHRLAGTVPRCRELIERAEKQFQQENYGAAIFFALKAQDLLGPRPRR